MKSRGAALVTVRTNNAVSHSVVCNEHGQVGGDFVAEGNAFRLACVHYVTAHMPHAVYREAVDA